MLILIFKSSDENDEYTTEIAIVEDPIDGHETLFIVLIVISIGLSVHSWLVVFTLYQEYTKLRIIVIHKAYDVPSHIQTYPNVATIENGIVLSTQYNARQGMR